MHIECHLCAWVKELNKCSQYQGFSELCTVLKDCWLVFGVMAWQPHVFMLMH